MRTFAQKQNRPQQKLSASRTRSNALAPATGRQAHPPLHLQRTIGNQAVLRLLQDRVDGLQPKLALNTPGDIYEQEAEVAATPLVHKVFGSTGQPLDVSTRAFFEPRFGYDFSRVRVHNNANADTAARALNARAFTIGRDVMFASGEFRTETAAGRRLLAHELGHVIQQSGGSRGAIGGLSNAVIQRDRRKPKPGKATSEEKLVDVKQVSTRRGLTDVIKDLSGSISEKDWDDKKKAAINAEKSGDSTRAIAIYLELYTEIMKLAQADKLANVFGIQSVGINLATSEKDLKPGLNFSISFKEANGRTSFLDDTGLNHQARLPVTLSGLPSIAILIGPIPFNQNKTTAVSTLRHEMMHAENNRSTINLLEKWQKQNKEKIRPSEAESKFKLWLTSQKKSIPQLELDLANESAQGGRKNSELLGYVEGFMTSFHLERVLKDDEILKGEVSSVALLELRTAGDWWFGATQSVQSEALGRIQQYFCDVLDQPRRDVFDKWVTRKLEKATSAGSESDKQTRVALAPIIPFLKNLKSIKTGSCSKKPSK